MTTRVHLALHSDAATPPSPATGYSVGEPFVTSDGVVWVLQSDGATWKAGASGGGAANDDVQIIIPGTLTVGTNVVPPGIFVGRVTVFSDIYLGVQTAPSTGACELRVHYATSGSDGTGPAGYFDVQAASGAATGHASLTGSPVTIPAASYLTIEVVSANGAADANVALLGTASS